MIDPNGVEYEPIPDQPIVIKLRKYKTGIKSKKEMYERLGEVFTNI